MSEQTPLIELMALEDLFAMPLRALIEADGMAARTAAEFIREHAFEPTGTGSDTAYGRLRMVTFTYEIADENGQAARQEMAVPLLLMITLPLLSVREATFEFGIEIAGTLETDQDGDGVDDRLRQRARAEALARGEDPDRQAARALPRHRVFGNIARAAPVSPIPSAPRASSARQDMTGDVKVRVMMDQSGLPTGIAELLRLTSDGAVRSYPAEASYEDGGGDDGPIGDGPGSGASGGSGGSNGGSGGGGDPGEPGGTGGSTGWTATDNPAVIEILAGAALEDAKFVLPQRPGRALLPVRALDGDGKPVTNVRFRARTPGDKTLVVRPETAAPDDTGVAEFAVFAGAQQEKCEIVRKLVVSAEYENHLGSRATIERELPVTIPGSKDS